MKRALYRKVVLTLVFALTSLITVSAYADHGSCSCQVVIEYPDSCSPLAGTCNVTSKVTEDKCISHTTAECHSLETIPDPNAPPKGDPKNGDSLGCSCN